MPNHPDRKQSEGPLAKVPEEKDATAAPSGDTTTTGVDTALESIWRALTTRKLAPWQSLRLKVVRDYIIGESTAVIMSRFHVTAKKACRWRGFFDEGGVNRLIQNPPRPDSRPVVAEPGIETPAEAAARDALLDALRNRTLSADQRMVLEAVSHRLRHGTKYKDMAKSVEGATVDRMAKWVGVFRRKGLEGLLKVKPRATQVSGARRKGLASAAEGRAPTLRAPTAEHAPAWCAPGPVMETEAPMHAAFHSFNAPPAGAPHATPQPEFFPDSLAYGDFDSLDAMSVEDPFATIPDGFAPEAPTHGEFPSSEVAPASEPFAGFRPELITEPPMPGAFQPQADASLPARVGMLVESTSAIHGGGDFAGMYPFSMTHPTGVSHGVIATEFNAGIRDSGLAHLAPASRFVACVPKFR